MSNYFNYNFVNVGIKLPSSYHYGEDDGEPPAKVNGDTSNDQYTAGIQYMITRRMRRILQEDLGYEDIEVDNMEPQIAAVVIDRKLFRPMNGMPNSWKKSYSKPRTGILSHIKSFMICLNPILSELLSTTKKYSPYVLSLVAIYIFGPTSIKQTQHITSKIISFANILKLNIITTLTRKKAINTISDSRKVIPTTHTTTSTSTNLNKKSKATMSSSVKDQPITTTTQKIGKKFPVQAVVVKKSSAVPINQPILPPQIKINKSHHQPHVDKSSFEKATNLNIIDRFVIVKHILFGK